MPFLSTLPGVLSLLFIFISRNENKLRHATLNRVGLQQAQLLAPGAFCNSSGVPTFEQSPADSEISEAGNPFFLWSCHCIKLLISQLSSCFTPKANSLPSPPQGSVCLNDQGSASQLVQLVCSICFNSFGFGYARYQHTQLDLNSNWYCEL